MAVSPAEVARVPHLTHEQAFNRNKEYCTLFIKK